MRNKKMNKMLITFYKARARKAYTQHEEIVSSLSCGRTLADRRLAPLKRRFNDAMDKLQELGEHVQGLRL